MTEPWHDECRRLRAEGLSQPAIAARLRLRPMDVRKALNESEEQKLLLRRLRERGRQHKRYVDDRRKSKFQSHWAAKAAAPGAITPAIKQAAILAFSKHEIDRGELMKRITPMSKWRNFEVLP